MGFLDDLANTIKEAMAEAKAQAEGRKSASAGSPKGPVQAHPYDVMKVQQRMKQKAEEQKAAPPAPAASRQPRRDRPKESEPAKVAQQVLLNRDRIFRLMHQPQALRELFLIKELLDKPLAIRRR
jgi:hypothetical protein